VLLHDFFNDGQPEACANPVFDIWSPKELSKQTRYFVLGYPNAVIAQDNADGFVGAGPRFGAFSN
jgi:hypothetical protein